MLTRIRDRSWPQKTVIALGGGLIGVSLENVVDNEFRLLALLTTLCGAGIVAAFSLLGEQRAQLKASTEEQATAGADVSISVNESRLVLAEKLEALQRDVHQRFTNVDRQLGIQVDYQLVESVNRQNDVDADIVTRAMTAAKQELLVVDLIAVSGGRPDRSLKQEISSAHLARIEAAVASRKDLVYRRLCQLDGPMALRSSVEPAFLEHLIAMCRMRADDTRVSVKISPLLFPYKFVLIDDEVLVLQLHRYSSPGRGPVIDRELVIRDPQRELIRVFRALWEHLDDQPGTRTCTLRDLELES